MNEEDILASRITKLRNIVKESFVTASEQSRGFALRILGAESPFKSEGSLQFDLTTASLYAQYGGAPTAAYLGYGISYLQSSNISVEIYDKCWEIIKRLHSRSGISLDEFIQDDISVLGVVDGLSTLSTLGIADDGFRSWLVQLIERDRTVDSWSGRLRALSAELLEERGRLQTRLNQEDLFALALDLCLQHCWPQVYKQSATLDQSTQQTLMKTLLIEPPPEVGDLERSVIWLQSLNLLSQQTVISLLPSVSDTARILRNTQAALKRWVWDEKPRRKNVSPAHWLIDDEYHVQSLLWATLYPIFKEQLVDEIVLPGYGLLQPRADFGIVNLKLIVEVKILRTKADFKNFEEQIAGDLGVYFSDLDRFDRMIVYFYDDCDKQYPELYEILCSALQKRDARIEDVVFVRRPSMIPLRSSRNA
jgi:REase_DpnII-MboI